MVADKKVRCGLKVPEGIRAGSAGDDGDKSLSAQEGDFILDRAGDGHRAGIRDDGGQRTVKIKSKQRGVVKEVFHHAAGGFAKKIGRRPARHHKWTPIRSASFSRCRMRAASSSIRAAHL